MPQQDGLEKLTHPEGLAIERYFMAWSNLAHATETHLLAHGQQIPTETRIVLSNIRDLSVAMRDTARSELHQAISLPVLPKDDEVRLLPAVDGKVVPIAFRPRHLVRKEALRIALPAMAALFVIMAPLPETGDFSLASALGLESTPEFVVAQAPPVEQVFLPASAEPGVAEPDIRQRTRLAEAPPVITVLEAGLDPMPRSVDVETKAEALRVGPPVPVTALPVPPKFEPVASGRKPVETVRLAAEEKVLGLTPTRLRAVQRMLKQKGYDPRGIDGILGKATRSALAGWQRDNGLMPSGFVTAETLRRMQAEPDDGQVPASRHADLQPETKTSAPEAETFAFAGTCRGNPVVADNAVGLQKALCDADRFANSLRGGSNLLKEFVPTSSIFGFD